MSSAAIAPVSAAHSFAMRTPAATISSTVYPVFSIFIRLAPKVFEYTTRLPACT